MIEISSDPDAPRVLVEATRAVRQIILECEGDVAGNCVEASLILGWKLRQQGLQAEMRGCSNAGDAHWCVRSGVWILDPTSGQWGEDPVLVFREGSSDDWYEPGGGADISEKEIVDRFALWVSPETAEPLLAFAGLSHLEAPIERAIEAFRASRTDEVAER